MDTEDIIEISEILLREILTDHPATDDILKSQLEFIRLRRELSLESDRGCVLLATSHLDFMLEKLFRKKLVGNKKQFDKIFNFNGPVGTFSSKIILAYSLGFIPKLLLDDIENIRKIRNQFAHSTKFLSFEDLSIKNICHSLNYNVKYDSEARLQFVNVVSSLSGYIEGEISCSKKIEEAKDLNLETRMKDFQIILKAIKNL